MTDGATSAVSDRLIALFLEELQDNVAALAEGIGALETDPASALELVPGLFRAAHSLKGAAHAAGVRSCIGPCDRLETQLDELRSGRRAVDAMLIERMARDLDVLRRVEQELRVTSPGTPGERSPSPAPSGAATTATDARARVEIARLDQLLERVGVLATAVEGADSFVAELERARPMLPVDLFESVTASARRLGRELRRSVSQLTDTTHELRLVPFGDIVRDLDAAVGELARTTGREVRLHVLGEDVEIDREIGDSMREPLLHLVRNAVDHGIEPPDGRRRAGKPAVGTVEVAVRVEGSHVVVDVRDDGAGVDVAALSAAANEVAPDEAAGIELAFRPGVSTARTVTSVSGRGVGLDAVRARAEALGGSVALRSERGSGTTVEIRVPVSLTVLRVVVVAVVGVRLALPAASVGRLHRVDLGEIDHVDGRSLITLGGRRASAVWLGASIGLRGAPTARRDAVAIEVVGDDRVLLVDAVESDHDVVLRRLPSRLRGSRASLGAATMPDGDVVVVVNPVVALRVGGAELPVAGDAAGPSRGRHTVLLAEDSLTTRAMERSILESAGYDVVLAADGAAAWSLLDEHEIDVVVTDVDMPNMTGIELCAAIRGSARFAAMPVVLVTSLASDDDRRRGLEAGANAYIVKSAFEQASLLDAVRGVL